MIVALAWAVVPATAAPRTPRPSGTAGGSGTHRAAPAALLYDQTDNPGANATTSQEFEPVNAVFDNQSADDFVIPGGETWTIDAVLAPGQYFNGPGPAPAVNVFFYSDAGGEPGALEFSALGVVPLDDTGDLTAELDPPAVLGAGTHWVSFQADMDFTPGGQWGWTTRTVQTGNPAQWQNPGDGFATGCTSWDDRAAVCGVGPGEPDHIFRLFGTLSAGCGISGTEGDDILSGTAGPDEMCGLGGRDSMSGLGGDDTMSGGNGRDSLKGGTGADDLTGDQGPDVLKGGGGGDTIHADDGVGNDRVDGGPGLDTCYVDPSDTVSNCEVVV